MNIQPHSLFEVWSPDQVAECIDGISKVPGLYAALWGLVRHYDGQPRSEVPDDFSRRALCRWWGELSEEHQIALNRLANEHEKNWRKLEEEVAKELDERLAANDKRLDWFK